MPDGELDVTLSSLSLSSTAELSGNVLHATLANLSLLANGGVAITGALDRSLANLSSLGAGAVQISGALASTLSGVKTLVFGRVYKGIDSPYEDVASWTGHPLSGSRVRVRTGNLFGIFGEDGEFGIFAGDGWDSSSGAPPPVSSQYIRLGNIVNEFHNVPIKLYDEGNITMQMEPDAPSFAMGNPLPSGYDAGTGLWQGKDTDGVYKWRIGDPSSNGSSLNWTGDSLVLRNSSFEIDGPTSHLAFGNPPPTSSSSGTGIWIDRSGFYGLDNDERQVFIDTVNGAFYAGDVCLDKHGFTIGSQLIINRVLEENVIVELAFWYPTGEDFSIIWDGTDASMTQPVDIWGQLSIVDKLFIGAGDGTVEAGSDLNLNSHANNQVFINSYPACFVVYSTTEPAAPKTGMIWVDTDA